MQQGEIERRIKANEARLQALAEQDMYCYDDERWPGLKPEAKALERQTDALLALLEAQ